MLPMEVLISLRVIGGSAKGHRLVGAGSGRTRPIPDNVKKSLFDILSPDIPDSRCLDLFAGTGAIGIEALSRGARRVTFVECSRKMVNVIRTNLDITGLSSSAKVIQGDVRRLVPALYRQGEVFNIVFVDPPYGHGLVPETMEIISTYTLLDSDGIVIARHESRQELPDEFDELKATRREKYGDTIISFYVLQR
ncbi:MAG TPA: 16S rRNA (guanine(966)-N(2))-methyltransferase RsmD [Bacillota bacterium]|jgi:16S rRNA (guanine(966)-N(2))-methyltransferase RsmD|nr:16S rRNA (guanine(966)-N(2))-methyltransferase RsmD [Bacillota bacterium]HOJ57692.1 16S rRNA (guanine(966)-N(2))-methyltransferase RsmD [Bacillota bacterium]HOL02009.1 16S rRNA (guanine(966)-N(2))-methyltransferase RsmD [Bacillota bacterium]HPO79757.1 16S rRNA (guanine(966)-N(2))-methyltransferase RsmD [Bacillota bacterium]